ncbi:MAG: hypothetical protein QXR39_08800 [Candidatus Methanomethylicia archaeon]
MKERELSSNDGFSHELNKTEDFYAITPHELIKNVRALAYSSNNI